MLFGLVVSYTQSAKGRRVLMQPIRLQKIKNISRHVQIKK
jgi:hypothetical protein